MNPLDITLPSGRTYMCLHIGSVRWYPYNYRTLRTIGQSKKAITYDMCRYMFYQCCKPIFFIIIIKDREQRVRERLLMRAAKPKLNARQSRQSSLSCPQMCYPGVMGHIALMFPWSCPSFLNNHANKT